MHRLRPDVANDKHQTQVHYRQSCVAQQGRSMQHIIALFVHVVRGGGSTLRYVLPAMWMMSCFQIVMGSMRVMCTLCL